MARSDEELDVDDIGDVTPGVLRHNEADRYELVDSSGCDVDVARAGHRSIVGPIATDASTREWEGQDLPIE